MKNKEVKPPTSSKNERKPDSKPQSSQIGKKREFDLPAGIPKKDFTRVMAEKISEAVGDYQMRVKALKEMRRLQDKRRILSFVEM